MKIFFKLVRTFSLSYTNLFKNLNETNSILGKQNLLKLTQVKVEKLKQTDFHRQTTHRRLLKNWLIKKKNRTMDGLIETLLSKYKITSMLLKLFQNIKRRKLSDS